MQILSSFSLRAESSCLRSQTLHVLLIFSFLYMLLMHYARTRCFRDPTSVFFDPTRGYLPAYSVIRSEQANAFIEKADAGQIVPWVKASANPGLCVGFSSIARDGARYFKTAVGTVLEGLSENERADIHLILFIAHTDPKQHPVYSEKWPHQVADTLLLYDDREANVHHIEELETDQAKISGREKALFDYIYLLKACHAANASYVVMLEDDVVALDGWYHRTQGALKTAERQTVDIGASKWLYLRLFYTEEFLGWNGEEWPIYLFCSVLVIATVAALLLGARRYIPSARRFLHNETILLLSVPSRILDLISWYESKHIGYVDMLTEEYADLNGEIRWALTPSVLQHVGKKSSKADDFATKPKYQLSMAERLWSFTFETNQAEVLRVEHETANGQADFL